MYNTAILAKEVVGAWRTFFGLQASGLHLTNNEQHTVQKFKRDDIIM